MIYMYMILTYGGLCWLSCRACKIRSKLRDSLALLAVVPLVFIVGNALHEGSHALGLHLTGGKIDAIRLFPNPFAGEYGAFVKVRGELAGALQLTVVVWSILGGMLVLEWLVYAMIVYRIRYAKQAEPAGAGDA
jgi:hypothetical protein